MGIKFILITLILFLNTYTFCLDRNLKGLFCGLEGSIGVSPILYDYGMDTETHEFNYDKFVKFYTKGSIYGGIGFNEYIGAFSKGLFLGYFDRTQNDPTTLISMTFGLLFKFKKLSFELSAGPANLFIYDQTYSLYDKYSYLMNLKFSYFLKKIIRLSFDFSYAKAALKETYIFGDFITTPFAHTYHLFLIGFCFDLFYY